MVTTWKRRCVRTNVWKLDEFKHPPDRIYSDRDLPQVSPSTGEPARATRSLRAKIEDSGSNSDVSRSDGKEKLLTVFVAVTLDRMKKLADQDPDRVISFGSRCRSGLV